MIPSLKELRAKLNEIVVGQPELIDKVTVTVYRHLIKVMAEQTNLMTMSSSNLLIIGNTGTGKTYSLKELSKLIDIPVVEINCKSITQEGWHGQSFIDLLESGLSEYWKVGTNNIDNAIIYMDEFDKMCIPNASSNDPNTSLHLQAGILKYIEGFKVKTKGVTFDTSKFCFIFSGAFKGLYRDEAIPIGFVQEKEALETNLTEKLVRFGVLEELAGRITRIVKTNDFNHAMYRDLLCSQHLITNQWYDMFTQLGIEHIREINYSDIINQAVDKKLGARGLISLLEPAIDKIIEENCDNEHIRIGLYTNFGD